MQIGFPSNCSRTNTQTVQAKPPEKAEKFPLPQSSHQLLLWLLGLCILMRSRSALNCGDLPTAGPRCTGDSRVRSHDFNEHGPHRHDFPPFLDAENAPSRSTICRPTAVVETKQEKLPHLAKKLFTTTNFQSSLPLLHSQLNPPPIRTARRLKCVPAVHGIETHGSQLGIRGTAQLQEHMSMDAAHK